MMLTIMAEVSADEERRIRLTLEAVDGVRFVGARERPHVDHRGVRAVDRNVELTLLTESVPAVPTRLMPAARHVHLRTVVRSGPREWRLQVFPQSHQKPPIVTDDEPSAGSSCIPDVSLQKTRGNGH